MFGKLLTLARWAAVYCPFPGLRHWLLAASGIQLGEKVYVNCNVVFMTGVGKDAQIRLGDRVAVAPGVVLAASSGPNASRLGSVYPWEHGAIVVENDAWIGANAVIFPGVTVGQGAIVAAGAVVRHDVPPFTVVGGVPARVLKTIDPGRVSE